MMNEQVGSVSSTAHPSGCVILSKMDKWLQVDDDGRRYKTQPSQQLVVLNRKLTLFTAPMGQPLYYSRTHTQTSNFYNYERPQHNIPYAASIVGKHKLLVTPYHAITHISALLCHILFSALLLIHYYARNYGELVKKFVHPSRDLSVAFSFLYILCLCLCVCVHRIVQDKGEQRIKENQLEYGIVVIVVGTLTSLAELNGLLAV